MPLIKWLQCSYILKLSLKREMILQNARLEGFLVDNLHQSNMNLFVGNKANRIFLTEIIAINLQQSRLPTKEKCLASRLIIQTQGCTYPSLIWYQDCFRITLQHFTKLCSGITGDPTTEVAHLISILRRSDSTSPEFIHTEKLFLEIPRQLPSKSLHPFPQHSAI